MHKKTLLAAVGAALTLGVALPTQAGETLNAIKARGEIRCGVNDGLPGFSFTDEKGVVRGIDADFCRALAAAVFGDANKVKFTPLTAKERFTALQSGEIDVLSRNTTWTMSRDTGMGMVFPAAVVY
jgi:general L-amino acid transport system substrate-binding protein